MIKSLFMLALGITAHGGAHAAPPVSVAETEKARAAEHFHVGQRDNVETLKRKHLDGVRGYSVHTTIEGGITDGAQRTVRLSNLACNSAVFGLVQLEGAKPFVGKDNAGVFTKFRFRILDDWRAQENRGAPIVHLIMEGGEVEHKGEKVRVENSLAKYKLNGTYVLAAGNKSASKFDHAIYATPPFMEVSSNTIYSAPGATPFSSGTSVAKAKLEVDQALETRKCE